MNAVKIKNLTKKFGYVSAVDNISFCLGEGEILGFLGPNGAGKTTTIQMLLGVLTPTSGEIAYFGKNIATHREEILEQVNFSSTYTNLPMDLTVEETLTYTSHFYMIKNRKERISRIKKIFKLHDIFKQRLVELSSGQLTRLNLAKAFINFPKVLLLDEPTASLDPEAAKYIRDFLLEERKNFKVSIIITSHNMSEVQEICDRVIFINNGKIIADDTPENLAKSIKIVHAEFLFNNCMEEALKYFESKKIEHKTKGKFVTIDIEEARLSDFLEELKRQGVIYSEISIQKPTLEDYFLEVVTSAKEKKI